MRKIMNIITALSNPELHEELKRVNEFNSLVSDPHYIEFCDATCMNCYQYSYLPNCENRRKDLQNNITDHNAKCPSNKITTSLGWCKGTGLCGNGSGRPGQCYMCYR